MFTGLVQACGSVVTIAPLSAGLQLQIQAPTAILQQLAIGSSIAVQGVCLTVTALLPESFEVAVSAETLNVTNLANLKPQANVNLETCLTPTTAMGGHFVTGHVDGCAEIIAIEPVGDCLSVELRLPLQLAKFVATKGSITINGVSLTINSVGKQNFSVNLIAHTREVTTFKHIFVGELVNIEVDLIARYVARLITNLAN